MSFSIDSGDGDSGDGSSTSLPVNDIVGIDNGLAFTSKR
jgi:hypothetical protein